MLWLLLALLGTISTSLTTIFAKIGIRDVQSNFATCYRTIIVIFCCLVMCLIAGSLKSIESLTFYNWLFLILSGLATGFSWLCYYRALKFGDINKVAPIDKSSFILTSLLFMIFFFDETTRNGDVFIICMLVLSMTLMFFGTILMIDKKEKNEEKSKMWFVYALLSSFFASLVSLFVKIGLSGISTDLGTLIRTVIVFIFISLIVFVNKEYKGTSNISKKSWIFLTLSGFATGFSWLFEYYSLNMEGVNPIAVNSIGKLSILLTMFFSFVVLKEKFSKKSLIGLSLLVSGIVLVIIFSL